MLPSSHEQAATAVCCKVSWNEDITPGLENRAVVYLQSVSDVSEQIITTLEAFCTHANILNGEDEFESEDERSDALAAAIADQREGMNKIESVWLVPAQQVKHLALDGDWNHEEAANHIMGKNPAALGLLAAGTKTLYASQVEELAKSIRPFLDATSVDHGGDGMEFAAWPLIKNVDIFLRSEILENGICLVDLPGVADNVESRANIARDYQNNLEVTMIVANVVRASNDAAAQRLLSEKQKLQMKLTTGYNQYAFGFVLTHIDQLPTVDYIKTKKDAPHDPIVVNNENIISKGELKKKQLTAEKGVLQSAIKKYRKNISKLAAEPAQKRAIAVANTARKLNEAKTLKSNADDRVYEIEKLISAEEKAIELSKLHRDHWAFNKRRTNTEQQIQRAFQRGQERLAFDEGITPPRSTLEVISTSSEAYWKVRREKTVLTAFPTEEYSGIPGLKAWIHLATAPTRERHLDIILGQLCASLDSLESWCNTETADLTFEVDIQALHGKMDVIYDKLGEVRGKE